MSTLAHLVRPTAAADGTDGLSWRWGQHLPKRHL
jgi:hypothetical protein